uniref:Uncharacterized protein n=1 Tax=Pasiphaea japonica whispovirus TaxID=2984286 RepID=A0A9C7F7I8_9VIRU|nr:MAG: hypothetical protein [Pasiphaea japonica whispovirus]
MVAPHENGNLVRSLVRVPGSGSDMTAGSEYLDLARTSSLAASVRIPQSLPAALTTRRIPRPHVSLNDKLGGQVGTATGILTATDDPRHTHFKDFSASGGAANINCNPPRKRARLVYMTPQQVINQANRMVSVVSPVEHVLLLPMQPQTSQTSYTPNSPISLTRASLAQLIQERNNLRQENQMLRQENQKLQYRLLLFQQLFKDKKKLGNVVKRLGLNVQP